MYASHVSEVFGGMMYNGYLTLLQAFALISIKAAFPFHSGLNRCTIICIHWFF